MTNVHRTGTIVAQRSAQQRAILHQCHLVVTQDQGFTRILLKQLGIAIKHLIESDFSRVRFFEDAANFGVSNEHFNAGISRRHF
ncbi:hypothetical protein D3C71_1634210 [compost metagenome]